MGFDGTDRRVLGAATGYQDQIRGGGSLTDPVSRDSAVTMVGRTFGPGTYRFHIPVSGAAAVDVDLRASALTGTVTPSIVPTLFDGSTAKGSPVAFSALVLNTPQRQSINTLRGERYVVLEFTVPGGGSVTFDRAEYSAL